MSLNQAETFEWLRSRVQELETALDTLRANQATEIAKAEAKGRKEAYALIAQAALEAATNIDLEAARTADKGNSNE